MGQLMQMLMLATVVEGRLLGINPYGQPGVEAYKRTMTQILTAEKAEQAAESTARKRSQSNGEASTAEETVTV
jgi:glucose-6-phosphate isomerase